jgi:hypothetical protein
MFSQVDFNGMFSLISEFQVAFYWVLNACCTFIRLLLTILYQLSVQFRLQNHCKSQKSHLKFGVHLHKNTCSGGSQSNYR